LSPTSHDRRSSKRLAVRPWGYPERAGVASGLEQR
jgi:hypothetical protein